MKNFSKNSSCLINKSFTKHSNFYNSFGSVLQGRSWVEDGVSKYRFGMNGQEKEDDVAGGDNIYSAEYWMYDSRLGRRFNRDPKPNPSISEYACFGNNPISFCDPNGDTLKIQGSIFFKLRVKFQLKLLSAISPTSKEMIKNLRDSKFLFTIKKADLLSGSGTGPANFCGEEIDQKTDPEFKNSQNGSGTGGILELDNSILYIRQFRKATKPGLFARLFVIAHELSHLDHYRTGSRLPDDKKNNGVREEELNAVDCENKVRSEIQNKFRLKKRLRDGYKTYKL